MSNLFDRLTFTHTNNQCFYEQKQELEEGEIVDEEDLKENKKYFSRFPFNISYHEKVEFTVDNKIQYYEYIKHRNALYNAILYDSKFINICKNLLDKDYIAKSLNNLILVTEIKNPSHILGFCSFEIINKPTIYKIDEKGIFINSICANKTCGSEIINFLIDIAQNEIYADVIYAEVVFEAVNFYIQQGFEFIYDFDVQRCSYKNLLKNHDDISQFVDCLKNQELLKHHDININDESSWTKFLNYNGDNDKLNRCKNLFIEFENNFGRGFFTYTMVYCLKDIDDYADDE